MHKQIRSENHKEIDHLEDFSIDGKIIQKLGVNSLKP
jgi:hypothetical protein